MRIIFLFFCLNLIIFSHQLKAAQLNWLDIPNNASTEGSNKDELFGDYSNQIPPGSIADKWSFRLDVPALVVVKAREFEHEDFNLSIRLDNILLDFDQGLWTYKNSVPLVPGTHTLYINGLVKRFAEIDIDAASKGANAQVPIPSVIALFFLPILSLLSFRRLESR